MTGLLSETRKESVRSTFKILVQLANPELYSSSRKESLGPGLAITHFIKQERVSSIKKLGRSNYNTHRA